ncbi:hypothetical protein [Methylocapsa palsarum]|uniref:Uncharacterized protein n=1 Tax=Methylocapsa palsarum TaxID=1612308 RepID=A0A1I3ZRE1_9HYPH|nr:hypothetical protein [Methylocapsa palsarum]SFK46109.1 hypothetical protein SAMN05444581_108103 [Methylocapsa palsarum]
MSLTYVYFAPSPARLTFKAKRAARERRRQLFRLVMFALGGVLLLCAFGLPARAAGLRTLVIPLEDGYDFQDCLSKKRPCGFVVADAWCEANGLAASKAFGRADEMAGALADLRPADISPGSYVVTCGDAVN